MTETYPEVSWYAGAVVKCSFAMSELTTKSHRQGECRTGLGRPLRAQMVLLVLLFCPELFVQYFCGP